MRYIIILIVLILGYQGACWSQGNSNGIEQVVFPGVKKWGHPTSIQFYDTVSRKLINDFDFSEKNPYKLPYRLTSVSRDTTMWEFEIANDATVDTAYLFSSEYTICNHPDRLPKYINVSVTLADLQGDFVIVAYQMITMNQYKEGIGGRTTVYILDCKGDILQEFRNLPHDCSSIAITSTGKYLMTCFTGPYNCSDENYKRQGIRIFETLSKKEVYESNIYDENGVRQVDDGLFEIRNTIENRGQCYMFFDPANRKIYEMNFTETERNCLRKVTRKDFRLQCDEKSNEVIIKFNSLPSKNF